jgi:hypothetical protein
MAARGLARAPGGTSLCRDRVAPEGGDGNGPVDLIHALRAFVDAARIESAFIDTAWIESVCNAMKQRKRTNNACFECIHTIRAKHLNDCDCDCDCDNDCDDDCVHIAAPTFASLRMRCDGERAALDVQTQQHIAARRMQRSVADVHTIEDACDDTRIERLALGL